MIDTAATAKHVWSCTNSGQGGDTEICVDDVLVHTRPNDAAKNPVFTPAEQCERIIGGTMQGTTCQLP
jgi:hypothetical protein